MPTGIIFLMNQGWEKDPDKCDWMPLVVFSNCSVKYGKWSAWIYYYGPILVQNIFSDIMLILTAIHILTVKRQLKEFTQREEMTPICCNFDIQTFLEFVRLSALMGATWLLNFTTYLVESFGIFVFYLLILKRSTLRMLINRIEDVRRSHGHY
ncbi:probable G-protein coupled receptor Mth-like 12 isoform X2 [Drosophila takahashii]|uniref:probable G-protein coupled receptor Mth-like 12 isoform X2 n=1 Tax=Drosophila takahashii TaxID=29030 RepID=UPI003898E371